MLVFTFLMLLLFWINFALHFKDWFYFFLYYLILSETGFNMDFFYFTSSDPNYFLLSTFIWSLETVYSFTLQLPSYKSCPHCLLLLSVSLFLDFFLFSSATVFNLSKLSFFFFSISYFSFLNHKKYTFCGFSHIFSVSNYFELWHQCNYTSFIFQKGHKAKLISPRSGLLTKARKGKKNHLIFNVETHFSTCICYILYTLVKLGLLRDTSHNCSIRFEKNRSNWLVISFFPAFIFRIYRFKIIIKVNKL